METKIKRAYTRGDLTGTEEGFPVCVLCGESDIVHEDDCPLSDPDVLGTMVSILSKPRVEICEACSANGRSNCPAGDKTECTHESLMVLCGRYAVDSERS